MVSEAELLEGIADCFTGEPTPDKMIKMASYFIVKDHLYQEEIKHTSRSSKEQAETIYTSGNSDFLRMVNGKDTSRIMEIMDELMETMKVIQPRIYDSVMRRVSNL